MLDTTIFLGMPPDFRGDERVLLKLSFGLLAGEPCGTAFTRDDVFRFVLVDFVDVPVVDVSVTGTSSSDESDSASSPATAVPGGGNQLERYNGRG
jgi:hypothetical protein